MNIAIVVHSFPVLSETFVLNQIIGLIDKGHHVDIYAMHREFSVAHAELVERYRLSERVRYLCGPENYLARAISAFCLTMYRGWRKPHVLVRALNIFKYGRHTASLSLLYDAASFCGRTAVYDVIHCQFGTLAPYVLALKQIGAIAGKLVTSFRGFDATNYLEMRPGIYDELFKSGDLFLPVSHGLRQRLVEQGCDEKKIFVLRSGINCSKFAYSKRLRHKDESMKALIVARLVEKKGVAYAIHAVARLITSGRAITLDVVGDGELRAELGELIDKLGVGRVVRILGWRTHEEVMQLMESTHVVIAPSITAIDGDQEGIPNSLKEAMATGLPVIGTLHGGIPELIEDGLTGFLVPERDVDTLTDRLAYLMDHPEMGGEMGRAGRVRIEAEFDIVKLTDQLVALYKQLMEHKDETSRVAVEANSKR